MNVALPVASALCAVLVAGCGGSRPPAARQPATPVTPVPGAVSAAAPPASATAGGCLPTATGMPAGAASKPSLDVDGDGRDDRVWVSSSASERRVGITTASGATFDALFQSAAPVGPGALLVDPTGTGRPLDLLVSARTVSVLTVSGCALVPVTNPQGQAYTFGMGFTDVGTGMGCSTVAGHTGLVGLDARQNADGSWSITRTAVLQEGTKAVNGPSDTVQAATGSAALASAQGQVACGDLTLAANGVSVLNE